MMKGKILGFTIILLLLGVVAFTVIDGRGAASILPSGNINSGKVLGVSIGSDIGEAQLNIGKFSSIELVEEGVGLKCQGVKFSDTDRVYIYYDRSWRQGTICLISTNNHVSEIMWHYNFIVHP